MSIVGLLGAISAPRVYGQDAASANSAPGRWQHLMLGYAQVRGTYGDTQTNHVTQASKTTEGLGIEGRSLQIEALMDRDLFDGTPDAWTLAGRVTQWQPTSPFWTGALIVEAMGGYALVPAGGPVAVTLGVRYQKNTYQPSDERWAEVQMDDQILLSLGAQFRRAVYDVTPDSHIYVSIEGRGLMTTASFAGSVGEGSVGYSLLFADDWRFDLAFGLERQGIDGETETAYGEPLTLSYTATTSKIHLALWF